MAEDVQTVRTLGGPMARRQLHFVWILDVSGSMQAAGKIQALNVAISEALPSLRAAAQGNMSADVMVRAVTFSTGAKWHFPDPIPVADFRWEPVAAGGFTDMGAALSLVAEGLQVPPMPERGLSPVLVLVSDGQPTDNFDEGFAAAARHDLGIARHSAGDRDRPRCRPGGTADFHRPRQRAASGAGEQSRCDHRGDPVGFDGGGADLSRDRLVDCGSG